ncbi:MAG: LysM peptidoglycan-binding domain-containing protein [Planctomycetota bacterium]|jgi:hypothetical protein
MAIKDITKRPRRALTAEERQELFREFKLGIFALAALVALVVALCWDREGSGSGPAGSGDQINDDGTTLVRVIWQPGDQGGVPRARTRPPQPPRPPAPRAERPRTSPRAPDPRPRRQQPRERPAPRGPKYRNYVVKRGDRLWKIAETQLGHGRLWRAIQKANPAIKNPNRLRPGMVLRIPLRSGGVSTRVADGPRVSSTDMPLDSSSAIQ